MPLPNLFVIGAPKSGTTSLHRYLDQHPKIAMSGVKEPKFFLADGARPSHRGPGDQRACRSYVVDRSEYEALFHYPEGPVSYAGESSPFYLWHPDAPARIAALVPEARLIAVLREPTMRAYSNWADLKEQDREKLDFPSALAAEDERRLADWEPFWLYRSLGLYGAQLTRLFTVFPRRQVKIVLAEELAQAPGRALDDVLAFLGLEGLPGPLQREERNQTMYAPVDRGGKALETLFTQGSRARPLVPRWARAVARQAVRRGLRTRATTGVSASVLRARHGELFAADRVVLEDLDIDVSSWDEPPDATPQVTPTS
jgi:hypothetical protein